MEYIRRATDERQEQAERTVRLAMNRLQAVLVGSALADQRAILPLSADPREARRNERAFFDIKARYGTALKRLDGKLTPDTERRSMPGSAPALLSAIGSRLSTLQVEPQFEDEPPPGRDDDLPDGPGAADSPGDAPADLSAETPFFDYPSDVREAAQNSYDDSTRPALENASNDMAQQIRRARSGGATAHLPFFDDAGDIDMDQVTGVLTGVAAAAALGIGGVAGGALAALIVLELPKMIAAFLDDIGDLLIGTFPD